ncbi:5-(carboxyamino)imidazole ribonucleotide synthase [Anaeromicropila herbilytica]|uniref:N5-carboxyaminoimidazole ribonucleotide synthase n=1 Tax=Anaeromicropila herbilytica TaxID=2785025 RepID=A0A7R7EJC6_9FIRM|nr:5-(carboxyamino)imidazole ribonucleotide synthase [Anaeromicropila herbilytica]BCN29835.1 N5-carboxyaminoimidazole ribonucleotide synthase [Anaeromicropila herbilytica]
MHKIGIIGGGQLGKMMILDAKRLDYYFVILDPSKNCPAHSIADEHIIAGFDDIEGILELASKVDVVTYEFEHINVEALRILEKKGHKVYPSSDTLYHIQNKYDQKLWLKQHNILVPDFIKIDSLEDIKKAGETFSYPLILKTCTGGYDGKGNAVIKDEADIMRAYETLGAGKLPLMVEEFVPFEKEVSILVCRSANGEVKVFPVAENVHRNSILDETTVPAVISEDTNKEAMQVAKNAIAAFDCYGMLCIELFVTKEGHILVNELAPRPHNSGHYTIEGCYTSQYENHIRAILGQPLGDCSLIRPVAMKNIIGNVDKDANVKGLEQAYENPYVKIHLYGKDKVSVGRKMGHITATAPTLEEALKAVREAHDKISF